MSASRVAVLYPRGGRTGGPEALHQLVDTLRSLGVDAGLVAHPASAGKSRVAAYDVYDAPEFPHLLDVPEEVVIAPEVYVRELSRLKHSRKFLWWLSIDNSLLFRAERRVADVRSGVADSLSLHDAHSLVFWVWRSLTPWKSMLRSMEHLAQSRYAQTVLAERLGIPAAPLSDYIRGLTVVPRQPVAASATARIAFNPAKGARHIRRVQDALDRRVDWVPLAGLANEEVLAVLRSADVYLDLGAHPGKDRIPREAAAMGAVTIVAMRGSGANADDVRVPAQHKVPSGGGLADSAVEALNHVLDNLPTAYAEQASYRADIARQEQVFRSEVAELAARLSAAGNDSGRRL